MKKFLAVVIMTLPLAGCGRKGPLAPPEALVPAAIVDLRVAQQGESFLLSWSAPTREAGGRPLKELAGFRLLRREVLPPAEDCEECPDAYRLIATVDLEYLREARRFGDRFFYGDAGLRSGATYQYKLVAFRRDGTASRDSNRSRHRLVLPPPPPVPKGLFTSAGIILEWPAVTTAGSAVVGYNVYRWREGQPIPPVPLNERPLTEPRFEDLRLEQGIVYSYAVRTVAGIEGEVAESAPSALVTGSLAPPE